MFEGATRPNTPGRQRDAEPASGTRLLDDVPEPSKGGESSRLSAHERQIARALAEAAMPAVGSLPGGGEATVHRYEQLLANLGASFARAARAGLWTAEAWPLTRFGLPFTMLSRQARESALVRWSESPSRHERWLLRAILTPMKSAHFDDPRLYEHVGCRYETDTPATLERASWRQQVIEGRTVLDDLDITCEVVVVGSGAGGAAAAFELAKRGRAVLLLEAGEYRTRAEFHGRATEAYRRMYLGLGTSIAIGNVAAAILAGRGVGGSTTINSGTCYRAPEWTLARWGDRYGLTMLSTEHLAPYYDRVEAMLGVAEAPHEHLGGTARVIARGAELLQLSHKPLRRNAPGCDGQGVCCFGCPTGAKRSTDVSYVPEALKRGAQLVTGAHVHKVIVEGGRARGVTARLASGRALTVRAEAVVVAGGALLTPLLLSRSGIGRRSGRLGKNLSIHPATKVMALFEETIDMSRGIPQSYAIDSYAREGLMFEGASTPLDVTAVAVPWVGHRFMNVMARYPKIATFGLMLQDTSRGEVRAGLGGEPLIRYDMSARDVARVQRGIEILSTVFLRAGASRVMPMVAGCEEISDEEGLARLRRMRLRAGDFEVSAFHPLGTCRMGTDPSRSCVGPDGEAHDVTGLYVADGSAVPSSLGVNPQMTIMALALRTAEILDGRLDAISAARPRDAESAGRGTNGARAPQLTFEETMSGSVRFLDGADEPRPLTISLRARSHASWDLARMSDLEIAGQLTAEGFGMRCPLAGTLALHVVPTRRIAYDFEFTADDGCRYRFVGHKRVRIASLRQSMTTLPARILDDAGTLVARVELKFDLERDLWDFLRSFRLSR